MGALWALRAWPGPSAAASVAGIADASSSRGTRAVSRSIDGMDITWTNTTHMHTTGADSPTHHPTRAHKIGMTKKTRLSFQAADLFGSSCLPLRPRAATSPVKPKPTTTAAASLLSLLKGGAAPDGTASTVLKSPG